MSSSLFWIRSVLIGLGLIGTVLFFPISLGDDFTCIFHRLIGDVHHEENGKDRSLISHTPRSHHFTGGHNASLNVYIRHFSIFWWGSLGLLSIGLYYPRIRQLVISMRSNRYSGNKTKHSN